MTPDLFEPVAPPLTGEAAAEPLAEGAVVLRGFALPAEAALLDGLQRVVAQAPLRRMVTPGGFTMSVAMTNCGALGWVSDRRGYRYAPQDPDSARPRKPAFRASRPMPAWSIATSRARA